MELSPDRYYIARDTQGIERLHHDSRREGDSIEKVARFVLEHQKEVSYTDLREIYQRFMNRYTKAPFGRILNFFYLLFHKELQQNLEKTFRKVTTDFCEHPEEHFRELLHLLPEFHAIPSESVKRRIEEKLVRDQGRIPSETKKHIGNALRRVADKNDGGVGGELLRAARE